MLFLTDERNVARDDIIIGIGKALLFSVQVTADGEDVGICAQKDAAVMGFTLASAIGNNGDLLADVRSYLGADT